MPEEKYEQWYMEMTSPHWDMKSSWIGSRERWRKDLNANTGEE